MARAGDYATRFEWLRRTPGTPDGYGERHDTYPNQGYLWGTLEGVSAGRAAEKESERQQVTATVRFRNYPGVGPGDFLRDAGTGDEWEVLTAVALDNELYCEVQR